MTDCIHVWADIQLPHQPLYEPCQPGGVLLGNIIYAR